MQGFTLLELLVSLTIVTVLAGIATFQLQKIHSSAESGATHLIGFFKQTRARAMATTSAYRVTAESTSKVIAERGTNCSAASWETDGQMILPLPSGVSLSGTSWNVCFSSRGMPDQNITVDLFDRDGQFRSVEVMLGGNARMVE